MLRPRAVAWCLSLVVSACAGRMMPDAGSDITVRDVPWQHPDVPMDVSSDPRVYVQISDSLRGEGLPCKITVHGVGTTPTPNWGTGDQLGEWLDEQNWALGMGRWVLMARGRALLTLAPGQYEFTIEKKS